jgi:hypothetical protein
MSNERGDWNVGVMEWMGAANIMVIAALNPF